MTDTNHDPVQLSILSRLHTIDSRLDHLIETIGPELVDHRHQLHDIQAELGQLKDRLDSVEEQQQ